MFTLVYQNSQAAMTGLFIEGLKITYDILIPYTYIICCCGVGQRIVSHSYGHLETKDFCANT